jgi:hypothetical protein
MLNIQAFLASYESMRLRPDRMVSENFDFHDVGTSALS